MNKTTFFTGQPIFTQLLKFIPRDKVQRLAREHGTDRYYKLFKSYEHLVTMLYTCFHGCKSLREVTTGMQVCFSKLDHLSMRCIPRRSTLSDANKARSPEFFGDLYHSLYRSHYGVLPDSRMKKSLDSRLFIIDSTTIKLFSDVMRGMGDKPLTGKQKGGAKAHVLLKADEDVPRFVCITEGVNNDRILLGKFSLQAGSILVFDRGYNNYHQMSQWDSQGVIWVTRLLSNSSYEVTSENLVSDHAAKAGVLTDQQIIMGKLTKKTNIKLPARKITFLDSSTGRQFEFITNNNNLSPLTIASLYKKRWQIELLFKRIKQNYPLRYFLGDNENAIRIQIWCALITDLLVKIVKDRLKRKWSYANIASMIRLHLMSYVNLFKFLNNPEKTILINYPRNRGQLSFQT
jgi:hypothetical protein